MVNDGRAVVLGPGGVVGTAWLLGVAEGLRRNGIELADADLLVGTSAGAIVGALLADGRDLAAHAEPPTAAGPAPQVDPVVTAQVLELLRGPDAATAWPRIAELTLNASTAPEQLRIEGLKAMVGEGDWPHPRLLIPTVDVHSGAPKVWRGTEGVPVHLVITASTAMPGMAAPVTIDGRRYVDGALRNGSNADLAEGMSTLVLIEPLAHLFATKMPSSVQRVARIVPDPVALDIFGPDLNDGSAWTAVFGAGLRQGKGAADEIRSIWT